MSLLLLLRTSGRTLTLALGAGSFSLVGQDAIGVLGEPLACGAFSLTGEPAAFGRTHIFPTSYGPFTFAGESAGADLAEPLSRGVFALFGEPAGLFISYPVPPAATAKFSWHMQGLRVMVPQPARAIFYWKV